MATKTKKERNAVNAVKDYIDSTAILRSFLAENDKTPLWDGTIFVYSSEPDKNENLIGTLKTQIKGTEVTEFKERERYRISRKELNLYLNEGGLFYFVVELLENDYRERKLFYKKLTPVYLKTLIQSKPNNATIEITLDAIPSDYRILEDDMINFIIDSRKQASFTWGDGLKFSEAIKGDYPIRAEGFAHPIDGDSISRIITSRPLFMYQETPYAKIPIQDVELIATATEHIQDVVKIGERVFFDGYKKIYNLKTITTNIGDCFIVTGPKEEYGGTLKTTIEIRYPRKGHIDSAINAVEFLRELMERKTITFGDQEIDIAWSLEMDSLFKDVPCMFDLYHDIKKQWIELQIPGTFSFDDFDETGLNQYLDVVQHVHRGIKGIPNNSTSKESFYSIVPADPLLFLIYFTYTHDGFYVSTDAFSNPLVSNDGIKYPLLTLALIKSPDILFDNIHYKEQFDGYKECLQENPHFARVINNDISKIKHLVSSIKNIEKKQKVEVFVEKLQRLVN